MKDVLHQLVAAVKTDSRNLAGRLGRKAGLHEALGWIGIENGRSFNVEIENVSIDATIVVYFGDEPDKMYQLLQWLPILEQLHESYRVVLLFRDVATFRQIRRHTELPRMFVRRFSSLMDLYEDNQFQLVLYVNNSRKNFQSLEHPRLVHVHINHGESDKLSMVSNKAKAYDRVLVAGPAAIERYKARLIDFDLDKLVISGRPQLDVRFEPTLAAHEKFTVMYAPTWEGENEDNNYTSIDCYGVNIVRALLSSEDFRVIYKPHPRIIDSRTSSVRESHERICALIDHSRRTGSDHEYHDSGNVLAMFDAIDALVADVSSVGLDFLYLCPNKPLVITDRRDNFPQLLLDTPIAGACNVISARNLSSLNTLLPSWIKSDDFSEERRDIRSYYFGNISRGESTERFFTHIADLLMDRRKKLPRYRAWHSAMADEATSFTPNRNHLQAQTETQ